MSIQSIGFWQPTKSLSLKDKQLPIVKDNQDCHWDENEKQMVLSYLEIPFLKEKIWDIPKSKESTNLIEPYTMAILKRTYTCIICNKKSPQVLHTNGQFYWPSGYRHYIEEHYVKPPQEFLDYVNSYYSTREKS